MSTKEKEKIKQKIPYSSYNPDNAMDLDNNYNMTVAELGLQQSKRDQIIAFYLTILSFAIPNIISLDIENHLKFFAFLIMYIIGIIFCLVILRYRIYKEVYWIACKVLTQLCNIKKPNIDQSTIYTLYYNALVKNQNTIVRKNKNGKNSVFHSFRRQIDSAETLLFETLVLFSTFVGIIGAGHLYLKYKAAGIVVGVFVFLILIQLNYIYCTKLMSLYRCVDTELVEDLEIPFKKAWMLHCYVDDITEDVLEGSVDNIDDIQKVKE